MKCRSWCELKFYKFCTVATHVHCFWLINSVPYRICRSVFHACPYQTLYIYLQQLISYTYWTENYVHAAALFLHSKKKILYKSCSYEALMSHIIPASSVKVDLMLLCSHKFLCLPGSWDWLLKIETYNV